jgi:hypothetical protein
MLCCHAVRRATVFLILLGAALRIAGIFDDFWLDEIWSLRIAQSMRFVPDLLLSARARWDNNHPLITLVMYLTGDRAQWWIWRIPSLLAGIGATILAGIVLARRDPRAALCGCGLFALSYPLIFFSSEARGYSLAVFFALLALDALDRYLTRPTIAVNCTFVVGCVLGILSHLTFVHAYAGMLAWSIWRLNRAGRGMAVPLARLHLLPLIAFALVYFSFARHLSIGGAPEQRSLLAVAESVGQLLGSGDDSTLAIIAAVAGAAVLAASLAGIRRSGSDLWVLVLVSAVISPALVLGRQLLFAQQRQPIAPRYFLVCYAIALLGAALGATFALRRGGAWRLLASTILGAFVLTNLAQTALFIRGGRGHYSDAVAYMLRRDPSSNIRILSDHNLRTEMVLDFYSSRLEPPGRKLIIYDGNENPPTPRPLGPPMWVIVHSNKRNELPAAEFAGFVFDREFGFAGLSGYSWYLYRSREIP